MSAKKSIEHIHSEKKLGNFDNLNIQDLEKVTSNPTQPASPIKGSYTESTAINFLCEIIPVACSCLSYQSWNNFLKHFRLIFSNNSIIYSFRSGNGNLNVLCSVYEEVK
jgi:hypothetical protein